MDQCGSNNPQWTPAEASLEKREYAPGKRLFLEGDPGTEAYIIEDGRIEISKRVGGDETVVVAVVGKGDMIGEMALIDDQPRMATARAMEPTRVIVVPRAAFAQRLEKSDPVVRKLLSIIVKRLRYQTNQNCERATIIR